MRGKKAAARRPWKGCAAMAQPMTPAVVHKQYDEAMTAFRRQLRDPAARVAFGRESDGFLRDCACGVWQAGQEGITPLYVECYNAIYAKGNPVPTALFWELATAVSEYSGFVLPGFFRRMVRADLELGSGYSRRFVDTFTLMLLLFAAVDGKVSEGEAGFVNACADSLSAYCDQAGLPGGRGELDVRDFVTRPAPDMPGPARRLQPEGPDRLADQEDAPPKETVESLLAELDGLCGLEKVKEDVRSLINLVKVRKLRQQEGLPVPPLSLHLVFLGNPGTGKTTVARLLARIYHAIGVLSKGQLVEVDRSGLVAGFVGQTALKTQEVIQRAQGGVLFIDEAYALANQEAPNDFGREAIEVLLKGMEDHRDDLIVIVAGYTRLMQNFIHANPGLESRFNKYFYFEDYRGEQLMEIFCGLCERNGYTLDEDVAKAARRAFQKMYDHRDEHFGNARDVRNVFETAVARQANRLAGMAAPGKQALMTLSLEDLDLTGQEG